MKNKKNNEFKNYIVLFLIMCFTIIVCLYIFSWYRQFKKESPNEAIIKEVLSEVHFDDLDDITRERDFLITYSCTTNEDKCRSFEENLKNYLIENNLTDEVVYINLGYEEDNNMLDKIYNTYKYNNLKKKINGYPIFMVFSNGVIVDLLSKDDLTIEEVDKFFKEYDI